MPDESVAPKDAVARAPAASKTVRMRAGGVASSFEVPNLGLVVTSEGTEIPADKADAVRDAAKSTPGTVLIEED